jgi:hypothetical protein
MAVKRQKSMFDWLSKRPKQNTTGDPSTASPAADPGTQCANAESEADTVNPSTSNTVSTSTAETKSTSVDSVVENNTTDSHNQVTAGNESVSTSTTDSDIPNLVTASNESVSTSTTDSQSTIIKQDKQPSKNDVFKIKWLETFSWLCQKEKGDKSAMFCR